MVTRYGNPDLKSSMIHQIGLSFSPVKSISLRINYNHRADPVYSVISRDSGNPERSIFTYKNWSPTNYIQFSLYTSSQIAKWWHASFNASWWQNRIRFPDEHGKEQKSSHPCWTANLANSFTLPWGIMADLDLAFRSKGPQALVSLKTTRGSYHAH